jgi:hypothetical protein
VGWLKRFSRPTDEGRYPQPTGMTLDGRTAQTLDLVLPVEWPYPPLVDIPQEELPQVAMHIAHAFREEAQRWEQQAFQLAADSDASNRLTPHAQPSVPAQTPSQSRRSLSADP